MIVPFVPFVLGLTFKFDGNNMEIWLDTFSIQTIETAEKLGILSGVTTNPSIVANSHQNIESLLENLLQYQKGPVTAQVNSSETDDMIQEALKLASISTRIIVKIPVTKNGLEAIHFLSKKDISTMATVIYTPHQALMAALAGANYIAPYLNRIERAGGNPWAVLTTMQTIFQTYKLDVKILGASINNIDQILKCAEIGIFGVTIKDTVFEMLIQDHPLTQESMAQFTLDFERSKSVLANITL